MGLSPLLRGTTGLGPIGGSRRNAWHPHLFNRRKPL